MKELAFQSLIVKTVNARGGAAMKMSNRFLVGVPDLLIQVPSNQAFLLEAKADKVSGTTGLYTLSITPRQAYTLRRYARAGMLTGVVSMLTTGKLFGTRFLHIVAFGNGNQVRLERMSYTWCDRRTLPEVIMAGIQGTWE